MNDNHHAPDDCDPEYHLPPEPEELGSILTEEELEKDLQEVNELISRGQLPF